MGKGYRTVTIRLTPETERQIEALVAASQRSSTRAPQTVSDILRRGVQSLWDHRERSRKASRQKRQPSRSRSADLPADTAVAQRLADLAEQL